MITPKVHQTKDYSLFEKIIGNRWIDSPDNELHVRKLMESFKDIYVPKPITVAKDYGIIDGQNRLEAWKRLRFPVLYIISDIAVSVRQIQMMNNLNKKWTTTDYLTSNMGLEKEKHPNEYQFKPYHMYDLFKRKYKFSHRNNLQLLCGFTAQHDRDIEVGFKFGKLKVSDWEKARREANFITEQQHFIKQYKTRPFVTAFINVMRSHKFSRKQWSKKIEMNSQKLVHCTNTKDYLEVIQKVYNWGSQAKVAFELKDAA
jgi:hypothetical protein|tara:strand:- start:101 stop:874 length:774 start_codon:yes stop_codon:yes gene_type:complete